MRLSVIVPVLNEASIVRGFLVHLRSLAPAAEIVLVDGGSTDGTAHLCQGLADRIVHTVRGRARQMNAGARIAQGDAFWFVHADSRLDPGSVAAIEEALGDPQLAGGCFGLHIVPSRWIYRMRDALGNLSVDLFRIALGDRGFFCRKQNFFAVNGYPEQPLLEDADFYRRLRTTGRVRQLKVKIQTSARRYEALGPIRTSLFYSLVMGLYLAGARMSFLEHLVAWFSLNRALADRRKLRASSAVEYS